MKFGKAFPSTYLKVDDLDGENLTVTIKDVTQEKIGEDTKLVIYFKEDVKPFVVNKTNGKAICKVLNSEETDEWLNRKITLYPTETEFKGDIVECIRVSIKQPKPTTNLKAAAAPQQRRQTPPEPPPDYSEPEQIDADDIPF